jgi:catechol 2,3-dioxygenase-like lactoylglutathione lyase family enzyme
MLSRRGKVLGLRVALGAVLCGGAFVPRSPVSAAEPAPLTGLEPDHAALSVDNLERETEWYARVLGFKMLSKSLSNGRDENWHMVIPGGYRIDFIKRQGSTRPALVGGKTGDPFDDLFLQQGWIHVSFHVKDVAGALKQLQALQINVKVKKEDDKPIQLRFDDPEGNEVEVRRNLVR